jgi:NAD(P)H-dependent FMN reductase
VPVPQPQILVLSGALGAGTPTGRLAALAVKRLALRDVPAGHVSLADHDLPLCDPEAEPAAPVPSAAVALARRVEACSGVLLVAPESNAGLAPALRNALDWIARASPAGVFGGVFGGRALALASAGPGASGGALALAELRQSLTLGHRAEVVGAGFALKDAAVAFGPRGDLADAAASAAFEALLDRLVEAAAQFA